ncbi:MAG: 23S rRNA (pseudouridine(1915)-N(3))-methyltransferase RlmH [Deltaproteobacteria bacterium]|nr:MAG: 23S rRNA (pseudouridine(1915)-N(3))-methyltransferase RlmH [Deltaproteobacteria bacterium]
MKVDIIFVGKTREPYLREGIEDFLARLRRYVPVAVKIVRAERINKEGHYGKVVAVESQRVAAAVVESSHLVILDRLGKQMSSEALARWWQRLERDGCRRLCFAVGGVLGFSDELRQQAQTLLSLSKMTFTHEMSRQILLEQLYRACTIMRGEKYHK